MAGDVKVGGAARTQEAYEPKPAKEAPKTENKPTETAEAPKTKAYESSYQASVLRERVRQNEGGTTAAPAKPPVTEAQARQEADQIIERNTKDGKLDSQGVAQDLKQIAVTEQDPARALAVNRALMNKIDRDDRDEVAQDFAESMTQPELNQLAARPAGKELLTRMQEQLLSGKVHDDEFATSRKIQVALHGGHEGPVITSRYPTDRTFGPVDNPQNYQNTDGNFNSDDPAEVAAFVARENFDQETQASFFAQTVEKHKDDPQFMQGFYNSLGAEKTAELMQYTSTVSYGSQYGAENQQKDLQNIADSLSNMERAGLFSQHDMERLVGHWKGDIRAHSPFYVGTELMQKASPELQTMFFRSASQLALDNPNDESSSLLAAQAAQVLSYTGPHNQAAELNALRQSVDGQGVNDLTKFTGLAMQGEATTGDVPILQNWAGPNFDGSQTRKLDGVSRLMTNAAYAQYDEPRFGRRLSTSQFNAIQADMFNAAGVTLGDERVRDFYAEQPNFKDAMTALYTNGYESIVKSGLEAKPGEPFVNGEVFSPESQAAQQNFFNLALFTPPLGDSAGRLAQFVNNNASQVATELQQHTDDAFFQNKYGLTREAAASVMGAQVGFVLNGLEDALEQIKEGAISKGEGAEILSNILLTGAGAAVGAGLPGASAAFLVNAITEGLKGSIGGSLSAKVTQAEIEKAINELKDGGVDIDQFANFMIASLRRQIPGNNQGDDALEAFGDGFNSVRTGRVRI